MDISETYIKMCDCEEIQEGKHWDEGDWYFTEEGGGVYCETCGDKWEWHVNAIWLPRQDQLQEMMFTHWNLTYTLRLVHEFSRWSEIEGIGKYENLSMEQLWLAFVMKKLYQKQWDGETWIK